MNAALAVLAGVAIVAGVLAVVRGLAARQSPPTSSATSLAVWWVRLSRRPGGARGRRRDVVLLVSAAVGVVVAAVSGWVVAIALVPALALGLPYLLAVPPQRDVQLLEALDRWVRSLAAIIATGKSVPDAIRISRSTAPPLMADEVDALVVRLNNRWETRDALVRFADAVDSADADGVIAALILAANRGSNGASVTLHALADSLQAQLKGRRQIEVERAKPYVVVRQVTLISLVTLTAVFVFSPAFFAPYQTPLGQALLSVLLTLYLGSLLLMRRKARQRARPRILVSRAS